MKLNLKIVSVIFAHPLFLLLCISAGIYTGFYHKEFGKYLTPIAQLYINFLQVTVIPIIAVTILTKLTKLLVHGGSNKYITRLVATFASMLIFIGFFSALAGYIIQPGKNMSSDPNIMKIVEESGGSRVREITVDEPVEKTQKVSIVEFLVNTVPNNVFDALSRANMLQIIVFCIVFSLACGVISRKKERNLMESLEIYLPVLHKINESVLFFLPIGSFCLLGTHLSTISDSALGIIFKLALMILSVILCLFIIFTILLWRCSKFKYFETLKLMSGTILMAFSTQSSLVCIPRAVKAMVENLKFDKQTIELAVPLGIPLCQFCTVCIYIMCSIFVVNIFNENINISGYIFIIFASILTSFAASGAKGIVYYALLAGVLAPLGLPLGGLIALFLAVDPLIDPFCTILQVYAACSTSAICCNFTEKEKKKEKAA
jgi:proton glutamate symport protein